MRGALASATATVPIGTRPNVAGGLGTVREGEAPPGDYLPMVMHFRIGRLAFMLSDNYHTDGKERGALEGPRGYPITIRADRPFVLDFSNRPEVMFVSPASQQTFKPGDDVTVKAVLTDPVLGTMIRRLYDASAPEKWQDLEPTVAIADSSGRTLARGTMPFG
jgi:hypothetical protein